MDCEQIQDIRVSVKLNPNSKFPIPNSKISELVIPYEVLEVSHLPTGGGV